MPARAASPTNPSVKLRSYLPRLRSIRDQSKVWRRSRTPIEAWFCSCDCRYSPGEANVSSETRPKKSVGAPLGGAGAAGAGVARQSDQRRHGCGDCDCGDAMHPAHDREGMPVPAPVQRLRRAAARLACKAKYAGLGCPSSVSSPVCRPQKSLSEYGGASRQA
jgi:hypothetical protein